VPLTPRGRDGDSPSALNSLHLLVDRIRDYAIYLIDRDGIVTSWNTGARRFKGYTADEIIGQHFSRFYTDEDRASGLPARALATAEHEGVFEAEGWRVRKDGTRFWASVLIDPIRDDDGQLIGFAKITRDITERRENQLALDEARAQLHQAQKMEAVGHLTSRFAHDFNNILQIISNGLELATRQLASGRVDVQGHLAAARDAADRARLMTDRLLAFARKQPLKPQRVDIVGLVNGMRRLFEQSLGPDITLDAAVPNDLWTVWIDPSQLENALLNLVINARDAMPQGGRVLISASNLHIEPDPKNPDGRHGDHVRIAVTDTGTGMTPEVAARAFEPFYTTKPPGQGTGLGLAQIYGFVGQSGGTCRIDSAPGRGTTIVLCLPRQRAD
jgi:PAS domain S-box-containing protein